MWPDLAFYHFIEMPITPQPGHTDGRKKEAMQEAGAHVRRKRHEVREIEKEENVMQEQG